MQWCSSNKLLWCSSKKHKLWSQSVFLYVMALFCMCVCLLKRFSHVWLFATPGPVTCQAPLSMGFFRQGYWIGLPHSPPGDLPDLGIKLVFLISPALAGRFFTTSTTWGALDVEILKASKSKNCYDKKASTYMK